MALAPMADQDIAYGVMQHCLQRKKKIADQPIVQIADAAETLRIRNAAIPSQHPIALEEVLERADTILDNRVRLDHPRFFGMIPSPASPLSWAGEMLNSAFNTNAACWYLGSGASAVERSLIEWAAHLLGLPDSAGGCFVSGGSMANLTALAAARDEVLSFEERANAVIYCSDQTHCSNAKALRILGFGDHQVQIVETDRHNRLKPDTLQKVIQEHRRVGRKPFCVMATCGTTNTGSIDLLPALSAITRAEGMWLHADGVYGASVVLSKSHKHLARGLEHCDSVSWDFHKWLFQVYGCALVLVRNKLHLRQSFATGGDYLQDAGNGTEEYPNFWNYGPEMSRPARGMKLWFTLQLLGLEKIGEMIDHGFTLSNTVETSLRRLQNWEIVSASQLAIVCFRYAPAGFDADQLDKINKTISQTCIATNICAPLTTRLHGHTVLRICSINPDLPVADMLEIVSSLDMIAQSTVEQFCLESSSSAVQLLEQSLKRQHRHSKSMSSGSAVQVGQSFHRRSHSQSLAVVR